MTEPEYQMPERDWGDDELAPAEAPTVIVSNLDGAPIPRVGPAVTVAMAAFAHGWTVAQTYALASVPARPRKAAHMLASVCVWMERRGTGPGAERAYAVWHNEDDRGWRFHTAYVRGEFCGARSIAARLSPSKKESDA